MKHKQVYVLRIGVMHVYNSMYFYYLMLFVIYMLLLDKLSDLHLYLTLCMMRCISAEHLYIYHPVGL